MFYHTTHMAKRSMALYDILNDLQGKKKHWRIYHMLHNILYYLQEGTALFASANDFPAICAKRPTH